MSNTPPCCRPHDQEFRSVWRRPPYDYAINLGQSPTFRPRVDSIRPVSQDRVADVRSGAMHRFVLGGDDHRDAINLDFPGDQC
jgi:hypothetical protein